MCVVVIATQSLMMNWLNSSLDKTSGVEYSLDLFLTVCTQRVRHVLVSVICTHGVMLDYSLLHTC